MAYTNDRERKQCDLLRLTQIGNGIGDGRLATDAVVPKTNVCVQLKTRMTKCAGGHVNMFTARHMTPEHLMEKINKYLRQIFVVTVYKYHRGSNTYSFAGHYVASTRAQRRRLFQRAIDSVINYADYFYRKTTITKYTAPYDNEYRLYIPDFRRAGLELLTTKQAISVLRNAVGQKYDPSG